jgi:hypothetical protein
LALVSHFVDKRKYQTNIELNKFSVVAFAAPKNKSTHFDKENR